jgi:hypothetical protein
VAINEEIIEENYRNNDFSKLNIFASHGVVDQVIPVTWEKQHPFFALGIESIYKEYNWSWNIATDFLLISKLVVINKKKFLWNLFFILIK